MEKKKKDTRCRACRFYAPLRVPRKVNDRITVHGYCFKDSDKWLMQGMGRAYPIYNPDGGELCRDYKRPLKENADDPLDGQLTFE